ncbi:hypothetical protein GCM10027612_62060 [Microbispora bryophytorum subsp. camponoti]
MERLAAALPSHMRDALPAVIRLGSPWPVRVDAFPEDGVAEPDVERWVPAVSAAGSNGDALDLAVRGGRVVGVRGRAGDRVNHGRLDPREWHAWQPRAARLTRPLVREDGRLVETTWDVAMNRVAARSRELLARPGGWGSLAFHTGTRLFLEEHYTLAVIGKAGIGTPHMDGDTRWGAAAAAAALAASFGTDGQPGSYTDVDHCDALALWGHDCAATHPVLWERMLDRRLGSRPPAMITTGSEGTAAAREADVHLAVRPGTNVALLNGLLHELIAGGWYDTAYVAAHTVGFERLWRVVEAYPAKRAAEICAVPVAQIEQAAEILGAAERLVSTVGPALLGSNQATAAACQVNNVHLLRGMLGRPGAGLCQLGGPDATRWRRGRPRTCRGCATGPTRGTCASWRTCGTSTPPSSRTGGGHARHPDPQVRRGGLGRAVVDHGVRSGGHDARSRPDPRAGGPVRRRPGPVPDRDGAAGRRGAPGGGLG